MTSFLDAIGYHTYDVGPLSEGWRFQPNATPYAYSSDGSFDHARPAGTERLASLLARASHSGPGRSG